MLVFKYICIYACVLACSIPTCLAWDWEFSFLDNNSEGNSSEDEMKKLDAISNNNVVRNNKTLPVAEEHVEGNVMENNSKRKEIVDTLGDSKYSVTAQESIIEELDINHNGVIEPIELAKYANLVHENATPPAYPVKASQSGNAADSLTESLRGISNMNLNKDNVLDATEATTSFRLAESLLPRISDVIEWLYYTVHIYDPSVIKIFRDNTITGSEFLELIVNDGIQLKLMGIESWGVRQKIFKKIKRFLFQMGQAPVMYPPQLQAVTVAATHVKLQWDIQNSNDIFMLRRKKIDTEDYFSMGNTHVYYPNKCDSMNLFSSHGGASVSVPPPNYIAKTGCAWYDTLEATKDPCASHCIAFGTLLGGSNGFFSPYKPTVTNSRSVPPATFPHPNKSFLNNTTHSNAELLPVQDISASPISTGYFIDYSYIEPDSSYIYTLSQWNEIYHSEKVKIIVTTPSLLYTQCEYSRIRSFFNISIDNCILTNEIMIQLNNAIVWVVTWGLYVISWVIPISIEGGEMKHGTNNSVLNASGVTPTGHYHIFGTISTYVMYYIQNYFVLFIFVIGQSIWYQTMRSYGPTSDKTDANMIDNTNSNRLSTNSKDEKSGFGNLLIMFKEFLREVYPTNNTIIKPSQINTNCNQANAVVGTKPGFYVNKSDVYGKAIDSNIIPKYITIQDSEYARRQSHEVYGTNYCHYCRVRKESAPGRVLHQCNKCTRYFCSRCGYASTSSHAVTLLVSNCSMGTHKCMCGMCRCAGLGIAAVDSMHANPTKSKSKTASKEKKRRNSKMIDDSHVTTGAGAYDANSEPSLGNVTNANVDGMHLRNAIDNHHHMELSTNENDASSGRVMPNRESLPYKLSKSNSCASINSNHNADKSNSNMQHPLNMIKKIFRNKDSHTLHSSNNSSISKDMNTVAQEEMQYISDSSASNTNGMVNNKIPYNAMKYGDDVVGLEISPDKEVFMDKPNISHVNTVLSHSNTQHQETYSIRHCNGIGISHYDDDCTPPASSHLDISGGNNHDSCVSDTASTNASSFSPPLPIKKKKSSNFVSKFFKSPSKLV